MLRALALSALSLVALSGCVTTSDSYASRSYYPGGGSVVEYGSYRGTGYPYGSIGYGYPGGVYGSIGYGGYGAYDRYGYDPYSSRYGYPSGGRLYGYDRYGRPVYFLGYDRFGRPVLGYGGYGYGDRYDYYRDPYPFQRTIRPSYPRHGATRLPGWRGPPGLPGGTGGSSDSVAPPTTPATVAPPPASPMPDQRANQRFDRARRKSGTDALDD